MLAGDMASENLRLRRLCLAGVYPLGMKLVE